jgi:uncharacterized membrane protein YfbV (UPF0208 family)
MILRFKEADILHACGRTYVERGRQYQRAGRVLKVEMSSDGLAIGGLVQGSAGRRYEQSIEIEPMSDGAQIYGRCSCPMEYDCKHVAAALLEVLVQSMRHGGLTSKPGRVRTSAPDELQEWWRHLSETLTEPARSPHATQNQQKLLYILQLRKTRSTKTTDSLFLSTFKSRLLKKGGWGKMTPMYWSQLTGQGYGYGDPPSWLDPLDRQIVELLSGRISWEYSVQIEGDVGVLLLKRLLKSGRCFLEGDMSSPISPGPAREARFDWSRKKKDQVLSVALDGVGGPWLPLSTDPPWYLDFAGHLAGPVIQPLDPRLFHSLCLLPPVPQERLPELVRLLAPLAPSESLALPIDLQIERFQDAPVPVLHLQGVRRADGVLVHVAQLCFDYGPWRLHPWAPGDDAVPLLHRDGRDWLIERNPAIERERMQHLVELGFEPAQFAGVGRQGETDLLFTGRTTAQSAARWQKFLSEAVPNLKDQGWRIETDQDSFRLRFEQADTVTARLGEGEAGWFDIGLDLMFEGRTLELLPLLLQALEEGVDPTDGLLVAQGEGRWLEIPAAMLAPVLDTLFELYGGLSLGRRGELRLHRSLAPWLEELESRMAAGGTTLQWEGGENLRALAERLRGFQGLQPLTPPTGLQAELRSYQQRGLAWLQFLREFGFGGILADDMGLGKTVQALAHLLYEQEAGRLERPVLVVAPTSVLGNWQREAERFAPQLRVLVSHGAQRSDAFDRIDQYDLVITSYALLPRDGEVLSGVHWHTVILDEAQAIKNPRTQGAKIAAALNADQRLCLTGTPMENHLGEIWSLFHFLMPGFLGPEKSFNAQFRTPVEKRGDALRRLELVRRVSPFVLRRTKEMVASELPAKTEMVRKVELEGGQRRLYESIRLAMVDKVSALLSRKGLARSHIEVLDALLKLRQACCDPRLVPLDSARGIHASAKLTLLLEMLDSLFEEGRRILLFSQFTSMLSLIEPELERRGISYLKLTGRTRKRQELIDRFQSGEVPLFLISLKAGGVGLNLTAADTVIHYDPWWNPAVERQATDRAHRIGQDKPVFVYKLVAADTVEEKILQLQERKQALADGIYGKGEQETLAALSSEEILSLFSVGEGSG